MGKLTRGAMALKSWPAILALALLACIGASGCSEEVMPEATAAATSDRLAQEWLAPTPTLVPALATLDSGAPTSTPTPGPTATDTPEPTPTLAPGDAVAHGHKLLHEGDSDGAARAFQAALSQPGALDRAQQASALSGLGEAYLIDERFADAADALERYLALTSSAGNDGENGSGPEAATAQMNRDEAVAQFRLGQAQQGKGDCEAAIETYTNFVAAQPQVEAYVQPRIAACREATGDVAGAIAAYEAAAVAPAHRLQEVETRLKLAALLLAQEDYAAAIVQYDGVHDLAQTETTRGEMTYLAGQAALAMGDEEAAHERYRMGIEQYPGSYHSYLGLVALVDAGVAVDDFQRGLVDYYARVYEPAIAAFDSYILANPDSYRADTRLYLAWCYEALGNLEAALAQLDAYAGLYVTEEGAPHAARAVEERGKMLARAGRAAEALTVYESILESFPQSEEARSAVWRMALLSEGVVDSAVARERYLQVPALFPDHTEGARALFRAGMLAWQSGELDAAHEAWNQLVAAYPHNELAAAGLVWLLRTTPEAESEPVVVTATNRTGVGYYTLRARDLALGVTPFEPPQQIELEADEAAELVEAEAWLADWLDVEQGEISSDLDAQLAGDARFIRGSLLWELGLRAEGKRELEELRMAVSDDALYSYQLALAFRDIGIYRSSILAADTVINLSGQSVFEAPRLLGRLSYPVYYSDLVLQLADSYGYDPLLQFALIRQESLYESFIASHAGAQGLSQVMPATGADIATRLAWPDYETEDLNRPYVGLAFGAYYLSQQLAFFDGDVYVALSAYNGGPGSAMRWQAAAPDDPDLYLETVDFSETRQYIQRIYVGYDIYRSLYGMQ